MLYGAADTKGNGSDRKTDVASITLVADGKRTVHDHKSEYRKRKRTKSSGRCAGKILTTMSGVMDFWMQLTVEILPLDAVRPLRWIRSIRQTVHMVLHLITN